MKRNFANDNSNSSLPCLPMSTTSSSNYSIDIESMGETKIDDVIRMNNFGFFSIESSDYDHAINYFGQALDKANSETTTYYLKSDASSGNIISSHGSNNISFPELATDILVSKATISPFIGLSATLMNIGSEKKDTEVSKNKLCDEYDVGMNIFSVPILLDANKKISLTEAITTISFNLGQSYLRKNENEAAFASFTKSYEIAQWIRMRSSSTNGPNDLSNSSLRSKNYGSSRHVHFTSSNNATDNIKLHSNHGSNATSLQDMISLDGCASIMTILHNIGYVQYRTGQYEEAIRTYARALHLGKSSFHRSPQDMLQIAATLNCLGVIYYHLPKPETGKSMDLFIESLAIQRSVYCIDAETKEIATILNNIGNIHFMKGELDQAFEQYQQSMSMRRRLLGDNHIDVAAIIYNVAQAYHQRGDIVEAMKSYQEFLIIARKRLGIHHRDVTILLKEMEQIHHHERKECTEEEVAPKIKQLIGMAVLLMKIRATIRILIITLFVISFFVFLDGFFLSFLLLSLLFFYLPKVSTKKSEFFKLIILEI